MRQIRRWCNNMNISSFDDLLSAARNQPEPQRLLFVFAHAELPDDSTEEQRAAFQAGQGGALIPLMSVDKSPDELDTFATLVEESRRFGGDWKILFVAGLSGRDGRAPSSAEAEQSLQRMIEAIKTGAFGSFMPFDRQGQPMRINRAQ
jgi:hypothetical protein